MLSPFQFQTIDDVSLPLRSLLLQKSALGRIPLEASRLGMLFICFFVLDSLPLLYGGPGSYQGALGTADKFKLVAVRPIAIDRKSVGLTDFSGFP